MPMSQRAGRPHHAAWAKKLHLDSQVPASNQHRGTRYRVLRVRIPGARVEPFSEGDNAEQETQNKAAERNQEEIE